MLRGKRKECVSVNWRELEKTSKIQNQVRPSFLKGIGATPTGCNCLWRANHQSPAVKHIIKKTFNFSIRQLEVLWSTPHSSPEPSDITYGRTRCAQRTKLDADWQGGWWWLLSRLVKGQHPTHRRSKEKKGFFFYGELGGSIPSNWRHLLVDKVNSPTWFVGQCYIIGF